MDSNTVVFYRNQLRLYSFINSMKVLAPFFAFFVFASAQNLNISFPTKGQLVLESKQMYVLFRCLSATQTN